MDQATALLRRLSRITSPRTIIRGFAIFRRVPDGTYMTKNTSSKVPPGWNRTCASATSFRSWISPPATMTGPTR